ncbi:OmpA family protein [Poseidonocella sedimentorum]|uniref:OmpA-OmpF porin, OOP family n=1 Tax=Poseidonocella sedimentorum TaxID=871652 RepID=A0A1I6EAY9_9RHOB|nr:OmpA family protein [Poseidonocella sedimentorum]SFR14864.1 OmpA-OmpF porin, OOP family [Poseidonocella sedimentorum]
MRLPASLIPAAAFLCAAAICVVGAVFAATLIETVSRDDVRAALDDAGFDWAEVEADGLNIILRGTAEDEMARVAAQSAAGHVVDAWRVDNQMTVRPATSLAPPAFSVEMLRNDAGVSLNGLVPVGTDREALAEALEAAGPVRDFLDVADYPVPESWEPALRFAVGALAMLPRTQISASAESVEIKAIADSAEQKLRWELDLARRVPPGIAHTLDISAPRPVITPFTLRFRIDETGAKFDACSAHTEEGRARILGAARAAGLEADVPCRLGLGTPSPRWPDAVVRAIGALAELGRGSVTFSDADVELVAAEGTPPALFDRVVGELETGLPEVFSLRSTLEATPETTEEGPPEFTATRSPEGAVQLRGRLPDETSRQLADSIAKARFGVERVYTAARIDTALPQGWALRVLTGIEAFAELDSGMLRITPDSLTISGETGNPEASDEIASLLAQKLGDAAGYEIDVTYREELDPNSALPSPEQCIAEIAAISAVSKITFEPGSATIDSSARETLDDIAEVLLACGDLRIEIGGHTDSQGRESMNQQLSQQRAQSVLNELLARRVSISGFTAVGYGEAQPVADNGTAEGREENRRIEFKLIELEAENSSEPALESDGQSGETEATPPEEDNPEAAPDTAQEAQGDEQD